MKNQIVIIVISFICLSILAVCLFYKNGPSPTTQQSQADRTSQVNAQVFTLQELSKFDGQNGNPAYIAVNGIVYDVTKVRQWKNGNHQGCSAGKDLTADFPHKASILAKVPIVGKLSGN
ncbi:Cytochrome b5-like Heme/Steroid binding domain protein [Pelotomaculum schinkii]|uniref:Cytochrome b5-like Heme/Steroid binding domain protein n=1 Tax=Pelotomaculum schinkii TaxID=78350 RepID=A0A4Y7R6C1_9FIRM|nr:cytochrome b5 domain-containing protein [Pelotomaculum schinkii]TEB04397.1 Cytochrome b5-like Heme/Steroid binding domain protein [Pelotomaculum schinkii]